MASFVATWKFAWLVLKLVLRHTQPAQDVVEYGLLIAAVVVIVLLAVGAFGQQINAWFNGLVTKITTT